MVAGKVLEEKIDLFVTPEVDSFLKMASLHRCLTKIVFVKNPKKSHKNLQEFTSVFSSMSLEQLSPLNDKHFSQNFLIWNKNILPDIEESSVESTGHSFSQHSLASSWWAKQQQ